MRIAVLFPMLIGLGMPAAVQAERMKPPSVSPAVTLLPVCARILTTRKSSCDIRRPLLPSAPLVESAPNLPEDLAYQLAVDDDEAASVRLGFMKVKASVRF